MGDIGHHYGTSKVSEEYQQDTCLLLWLSGIPQGKNILRRYYYIKPDLHFYFGKGLEEAKQKWSSWQSASRHKFNIQIKSLNNKISFWIDGRFFAETGIVADKRKDLFKNKFRQSCGTGFRLVFSGITLRLDIAAGNEGFESQIMFDYPWNLFNVSGAN